MSFVALPMISRKRKVLCSSLWYTLGKVPSDNLEHDVHCEMEQNRVIVGAHL